MKKLGFIFITLAILIGLILPWAKLNFTGNEIGTLTFPNFRGDGIKTQSLLIRKEDSPVRVRFRAKYKVGGLLPPVKIPITVKVSDIAGTLIGTIISFPTNGFETGPEQPKVRGSSPLVFEIQNDGLHHLNLSFAKNKNNGNILKPDVEEISATFIANSAELQTPYKIPAAILGMLGLDLIVRSRKKGNTKPKMPRWGRGGS